MKFRLFFLFFLLTVSLSTTPACQAKYGCPSNEKVQPKVNRKGELKGRRSGSSSQLFDKKMRKRMGK